MAKQVAVVLSGCGFLDGAEIHEAVLTLLALDSAGAVYTCCAPDIDQVDVVNHATGQPTAEKRNVLVESARIARGKITPLSQIKATDFDALVLPGGYGAAKNLCDFANAGSAAKSQEDITRVVRDFVDAGKPVGAICISPAAVAAALNGSGVQPTLTIGTDKGTASNLTALGATHQECGVREFVVDKKNKIVSTPAYMLGKGPAEVYAGIDKLVKSVLELA